jgi:hypothetical protein
VIYPEKGRSPDSRKLDRKRAKAADKLRKCLICVALPGCGILEGNSGTWVDHEICSILCYMPPVE